MYEIPKSERSLWRWVLLAIAPGLICDALGVIAVIAGSDALDGIIMWLMLLVPPVGLIYLILLGGRYVDAGLAKSSIGFVVGYAVLNTFLWGAGCATLLTTMSFH